MTTLDLTVHLEHRTTPSRARRSTALRPATTLAAWRSDVAAPDTEPTTWPAHEFMD